MRTIQELVGAYWWVLLIIAVIIAIRVARRRGAGR